MHQYGRPPSCAPSNPLCGAAVEANSLAASPDGHLVAENYLDGHSVLRDIATWRVLGRLATMVTRFSWDGSRVMTVAGTAGQPSGTVREWATGRALLGPVVASSLPALPTEPPLICSSPEVTSIRSPELLVVATLVRKLVPVEFTVPELVSVPPLMVAASRSRNEEAST